MPKTLQLEHREQVRLMRWAKGLEDDYPLLALLFHIPNGGQRDPIAGMQMKRAGVKRGVPDLCLPVPCQEFHGMFLELKYGKGEASKYQSAWLNALHELGYYAIVCWGAEQAAEEIGRYLGLPEATWTNLSTATSN